MWNISPNTPAVQERQAEWTRIATRLCGSRRTGTEARVLAALGHPGYSNEFAWQALDRWANTPTLTIHQVVYGIRNYGRKNR